MLPSQFTTPDEMKDKLLKVANVHTLENAKTISHLFYDVFKLAYYALKHKREILRLPDNAPIALKRTEVTQLIKLIDYHHSNDKTFSLSHELAECFRSGFSEKDARDYFTREVAGDIQDKFGRAIHIDLENGKKFMYKAHTTGLHEINPENYKSERGERLPWIRHTLHNATNLYTRVAESNREIMYICKYDFTHHNKKNYWVVIVKKYKKDTVAPYNFKTAFPIFTYNGLLRRIQQYEPIIYAQNFQRL
ncbi:MAG: hypothetical protein Q7S07_05905 [Candidatus Omnitrophota bacterium]|nr:hypothetical protein [Candidatus Omnitrophota bacterium]